MPLDEAQVRKECHAIKDKGLTDIAVIGVFSPLDISGTQEARVKQIIQEEIPEADIVLSRDSKSSILGICPATTPCTDLLSSRSAWVPRKRERYNSQHINFKIC